MLQEDIHATQRQIDKDIGNLLDEMDKIKKGVIINKQKLEDRQAELKTLLPLKMLFGALNMGCQLLSFAGPYGAIGGALIGGALNMVGGQLLKESDSPGMLQIPQGAMNQLNAAFTLQANKAYENNLLNQQQKIKLNEIAQSTQALANNKNINNNAQLQEQNIFHLEDMLRQHQENRKNIEKSDNPLAKIELEHYDLIESGLHRDISVAKANLANLHEQKEGLSEINEQQKNILSHEKIVTAQQQRDQVLQNRLLKAQLALSVAQAGMDMYNTYQNDNSRIEALGAAIKASEAQIKQIDAFKDQINNIFKKDVVQMKQDLDSMQEQLKTKSHVALDVQKWQVKKGLGAMKDHMQSMTKGMKVEGQMASTCQKMIDAIEVVIGVYDRIQNFQDQTLLANYIADIASSDNQGIKVQDEELQKTINNLDNTINCNIVMTEYSKIMQAFRQWSFPFVDLHLQEFAPLAPNSLDDMINEACYRIDKLQDKTIKYFSSIVEVDEVIHSDAEFYDKNSADPFYKWFGEQNFINLSKLLNGEKVAMNAVITKDTKSAVKFTEIGLQLKSKSEHVQKKLDYAINHYKITLRHMGQSYYKYQDNIYGIGNGSLKLEYSFENSKSGIAPADCNEVYKKLAKGNSMLSPYGYWEMQIMKAKSTSPSFELSDEEIKGLELHLVGKGYYVDEQKIKDSNLAKFDRLKNLNLEKHYQLIPDYKYVYKNIALINIANTNTSLSPTKATNDDYHLPNNAFNQMNNKKYWYQASDMNILYSRVIRGDGNNVNDASVIVLGDSLSYNQLKSYLYNMIIEAATTKPVICIYNKGDMHWTTFAIVKPNVGTHPVVLYKDSQGGGNEQLLKLFYELNSAIKFKYNQNAEQTNEYDCGIFALENAAIMVKQLKYDTQAFINEFETKQDFCSSEKALTMRLDTLPKYYAQEIYKRLSDESINPIKRTQIESYHQTEIESIKKKLSDNGITVEIEQSKPIENIIADNDYSYYYTFHASDRSIDKLKGNIENSLATNIKSTQIYGNKIKLHPNHISDNIVAKQKKLVPSEIDCGKSKIVITNILHRALKIENNLESQKVVKEICAIREEDNEDNMESDTEERLGSTSKLALNEYPKSSKYSFEAYQRKYSDVSSDGSLNDFA